MSENPPATGPLAAPVEVAVITLFSAARLTHALNQFTLLAGGTGRLVVAVWLDEAEAPVVDGVTVIRVPPGRDGLRLAAGRNAGAAEALRRGARLLVFLDADCLPGPELLERYTEARYEHPESVFCGPVTYLPEGAAPRTPDGLRAATAPHAARPSLPPGETRAATSDEQRLFWSLSFACSPQAWVRSQGFDETYEGYGAEDTDFASRLQQRGIELRWVGGAHAYHQYHPTSSPPIQHLDDILRNGALYRDRWGSWPMEGWLKAFEEADVIRLRHGSWEKTRP